MASSGALWTSHPARSPPHYRVQRLPLQSQAGRQTEWMSTTASQRPTLCCVRDKRLKRLLLLLCCSRERSLHTEPYVRRRANARGRLSCLKHFLYSCGQEGRGIGVSDPSSPPGFPSITTPCAHSLTYRGWHGCQDAAPSLDGGLTCGPSPPSCISSPLCSALTSLLRRQPGSSAMYVYVPLCCMQNGLSCPVLSCWLNPPPRPRDLGWDAMMPLPCPGEL